MIDKVNVFFVVLVQLPGRKFFPSKFSWQLAIRFKAEDSSKPTGTTLAQLLAMNCPRSGQRYISKKKAILFPVPQGSRSSSSRVVTPALFTSADFTLHLNKYD